MRSGNKYAIIVICTTLACIVDFVMFLAFFEQHIGGPQEVNAFVDRIRLFSWGWSIPLILSVFSILEIILWKTREKFERVVFFFFSVIAFIVAFIWFSAWYVINTLRP